MLFCTLNLWYCDSFVAGLLLELFLQPILFLDFSFFYSLSRCELGWGGHVVLWTWNLRELAMKWSPSWTLYKIILQAIGHWIEHLLESSSQLDIQHVVYVLMCVRKSEGARAWVRERTCLGVETRQAAQGWCRSIAGWNGRIPNLEPLVMAVRAAEGCSWMCGEKPWFWALRQMLGSMHALFQTFDSPIPWCLR